MTVSADTLCQSGIAYPTAIEIARQMNLGSPTGGTTERLVSSGLSPMKATELARQINAGVFSADLLCKAMWNPIAAAVIKTASGL